MSKSSKNILISDLNKLLKKDKQAIIKWLDIIKVHKSDDDTLPHLLNNSIIHIKTKKPTGIYNIILLWFKDNIRHFKDYDFTDIPESNHTTILEIESNLSPKSRKPTFRTIEDVDKWKENPTIHPITGIEMSPVSNEYAEIYEKAYKILKKNKITLLQYELPKNHYLFGTIDLLYYKMKHKNTTMIYENICILFNLDTEFKIQSDTVLETEIEILKNLFSKKKIYVKERNYEVYTSIDTLIWRYIDRHMNDMFSELLDPSFNYKISNINNIINHEGDNDGNRFILFIENNSLYNGVRIIDYLKQPDNESWASDFIETYDDYISLYNDIFKLLDKNSKIIENYDNKMFKLIPDPLDKYFTKYEDALIKIKNPKFARLIDLSTFKPVKTDKFLNDKQLKEFNTAYSEKEIEYNKLKEEYEKECKKSKSSPKPPKRPIILYGDVLKYIYGNIRPTHIPDKLLKEFNKEYEDLKESLEEYNNIKNMSYTKLVKTMKDNSPTSPIKDNSPELFEMSRQQINDNILYNDASGSSLKDRCNEPRDILTNDELDDENYPLAKLQLMVRLKMNNKTECIYAPALYNYLVNCVNSRNPFINPITKQQYTTNHIKELMKVMNIIDKNIETPKFLKVANDTKLMINYEKFEEKDSKLNFYEIYVYRPFGRKEEDQYTYKICTIPADIEATNGIFNTDSADLTSATMLFKILKLFNDGRLLSKYVPPYYDVLDNGEYQYINLNIHFNRYYDADDWLFDKETNRPLTNEQFIKKFINNAEEINNFIY